MFFISYNHQLVMISTTYPSQLDMTSKEKCQCEYEICFLIINWRHEKDLLQRLNKMTISCSKCGQIFGSNRDLQKHLKRKFPCDKVAFNCKKCDRPFYNKDSFYHHQKHCTGKPATIEDKDKEIQSLKNALAATNGLNAEIQEKRAQTINNIQNNDNSVSIETLNQITQNIVILPTGSENIDHLRGF